jgi:uncharacterized radical SAM protein YgiQ
VLLPTTRNELDRLGWDQLDVILITGDSYIDSPFIGVAVIGKVLLNAGYRVGIIAQPDIHSDIDICRLGEPKLFWGVTGGCIDSMLANYTATKKKRRTDDYTPGGINNRRPDRAAIVYTNLIRRYFKQTQPIVLGGIEASLRRIAHYDYWSNQVRGSILFDAKADILLYGMAEKSVIELAKCLATNRHFQNIRGLCYISKSSIEDYIELPSFETASENKIAFIEMFHTFYKNNDPLTAKGLVQRHGTRYLIQNPPAPYQTQTELDEVYNLDFERKQHPYYEKLGKVKALETIKFSISTHRGCYGECNFCAIGIHEGRTIRWRSKQSILTEAEKLTHEPGFKGYILDVGGPTANMYGFECDKKLKQGVCQDKRCIFPDTCPQLKIDHSKQVELLRQIRKIKGVKKVFIASGIRYDLIQKDHKSGQQYFRELVEHHISGQLKVAPEHSEDHVLRAMGKQNITSLLKFKKDFDQLNRELDKKQFLTYYLIAAHPGCTEHDMQKLKQFIDVHLKINPEQVQIFTPTPSTYSSLMYFTEMDPFSMKPVFVEKEMTKKEKQKNQLVNKQYSR